MSTLKTATPARVSHNNDPLGFERSGQKFLLWLLLLFVVFLGSFTAAIVVGAVPISPLHIITIVYSHLSNGALSESNAINDAIVWDVRLPRAILAVFTGAGLAVCGVVMQTMVRNQLADPHLLGINSGASCGAAAAILFGLGAGSSGSALSSVAFVGAFFASVCVYMLASTGGRLSSLRLLLAGTAVGYALNALTSFLVFASGNAEGARSVMFWLLGSLSMAEWGPTLFLAAIVPAVCFTVFWLSGRRLDLLSAGDETARSLGLSPEHLRAVLLITVSACVGVLVSATGSIGFVGLVIPHLARRAVGAQHRYTIPVAALMGAILLLIADIVARLILQPQEIPIGILTALVGTPFLIFLIRNTRSL